MRGVLGLAAAISLPERLNSGAPFPERNVIIFLTFCAIFATLVLQGLSLPAIIRYLGLSGIEGAHEEEEAARREMLVAALDELKRIKEERGGEATEVEEQLERYYRRRLALVRKPAENSNGRDERVSTEYESVGQRLRGVERSVLLKLRDEGQIHDEILRVLERELDLLDARFAEAEY